MFRCQRFCKVQEHFEKKICLRFECSNVPVVFCDHAPLFALVL